MESQLHQRGRQINALGAGVLLAAAALFMPAATQPDVLTIIQKSVEANDRDYKAAPHYDYKEHDKVGGVTKTFQVTMIEGSPYQRLTALNGKPLSAQQEQQELAKQKQAAAQRKAESPSQRRDRIAKYERDRARDHVMMEQLSKAFKFALVGRRRVRGFNVWELKATPLAGYKPPNMECQVLPGMDGELFIDQKTYQWVRVTARVIRPVSIEGFLAQVQPGTRFEIDKTPVDTGIWQITHFAMASHAKVLFMVNRYQEEEDTFSDFKRSPEASLQ